MDKIELEEISHSNTKDDDYESASDSSSEYSSKQESSIKTLGNKPTSGSVQRSSTENSRRSSSIHLERRTSEIMEQYDNIDPEIESQMDADFHPKFPHFRAILFRRWVVIKRTLPSVITNIVVTIVISVLALICEALLNSIAVETTYLYDYNASLTPTTRIFVETSTDPNDQKLQSYWMEAMRIMCRDELLPSNASDAEKEKGCDFKTFSSHSEFLAGLYNLKKNESNTDPFVNFGIILPKQSDPENITMYFNNTQALEISMSSLVDEKSSSQMKVLRTEFVVRLIDIWKAISGMIGQAFLTPGSKLYGILSPQQLGQIAATGQDIFVHKWGSTFQLTLLPKKTVDMIFGILAPLLMTAGIASVITTFIIGPIVDINGPIRSYMVTCSLTLGPYWVAYFLVDFIIWIIDITLIWAVFLAAQTKAFIDNPFQIWYALFMCGPSFILYIYVISFIFSAPESAARNAYVVNLILMIIPVIIDLVTAGGLSKEGLKDLGKGTDVTNGLAWLWALFPTINMMRFLQGIMLHCGLSKKTLDWYFKGGHVDDTFTLPFPMFQFINIVIYGGILIIIEYTRLSLERKSAHSSFGNYGDFFRKAKAKHPVTQEANDMAEEVANNHDYAVRIENVSRLFFNTAGDPIPAVNCVSLGVKKGSTFGFLGANGAGKTTLINMITGILPVSDGKIEINGVPMTQSDPKLLSVCPQFNSHLTMEMTPDELLHFYAMLHQMCPQHETRIKEQLFRLLSLEQFQKTPIQELSEGDIRKVAIALSFMGKAEIILLDEPTATLDPVSRHQVHEMMIYYKGKKTFMLCTHLLSEAEALCDMISIMIKGNVYTCGTPQYLSAKFGTDFKIDMMLKNESDENAAKVDRFFSEKLPDATLSIKRPTARIYNVPAQNHTLADLFDILEQGLEDPDGGFNYYTASTSSLEKVFMEIVRISEGDEDISQLAHLNEVERPKADSSSDEAFQP